MHAELIRKKEIEISRQCKNDVLDIWEKILGEVSREYRLRLLLIESSCLFSRENNALSFDGLDRENHLLLLGD